MSAPAAEIEPRLQRAATFHKLRRFREAQLECVAILKLDPDHVGALMRYALIMYDSARNQSAMETYGRVLELDPMNVYANVNLAGLYLKDHRAGDALPLLRLALEEDPDCRPAQLHIAQALSDLRDAKGAKEYSKKAFTSTTQTLPYHGPPGEAIEVLVLCGWQSVNTPLDHAIDRRYFRQTKLNVDFHEAPLPFHHLAWNAVGEVEVGSEHLASCERLLKQTKAPVLNPPEKIWPTGRADNARRLAGFPGLIVPKIVDFKRETLEGPDAETRLREAGFGFPLLIRASGFQGGLNFEMVETPADLAGKTRAMPGDEINVLEFVDARDLDGKIRKYRAMMIDGKFYPLHAAVSENWKIHYFSAGMRDNPENRAEDMAFLEDMPKVLGPKAMAALGHVRDVLGLDYGGIDFSVSRNGDAIFFESNATMVVPRPPSAEVWDYRRAPVQRILDAVTAMLLSRAGKKARIPSGEGAPQAALPPMPTVRPGTSSKGPLPPGPSMANLRVARAAGMHKFGLLKEAKLEYAAVLKDNPDDVDALMKYGSLMLETGASAAAAEIYSRALSLAPGNAAAHADFGLALLALGRAREARGQFEKALSLSPDIVSAHQGLASLAIADKDLKTAREHGRRAFLGKSHVDIPYRGTGNAPTVLTLCSAMGGNVPLEQLVDRRGFRQSMLIVEYHDDSEPIPLYDVVFNAVGGPDASPHALGLAAEIARRCRVKLLNAPEKVALVSRAQNAQRLAGIPGLRVSTDAEHRGTDGGTRRYRILSVGKRFYPLSASTEEESFLRDPRSVLGSKAMDTLEAARTVLDLDYVGFDFSIDAADQILLHNSDPAMPVPTPLPGPPGEALRAAVQKVTEAVNDLLRSRMDVHH